MTILVLHKHKQHMHKLALWCIVGYWVFCFWHCRPWCSSAWGNYNTFNKDLSVFVRWFSYLLISSNFNSFYSLTVWTAGRSSVILKGVRLCILQQACFQRRLTKLELSSRLPETDHWLLNALWTLVWITSWRCDDAYATESSQSFLKGVAEFGFWPDDFVSAVPSRWRWHSLSLPLFSFAASHLLQTSFSLLLCSIFLLLFSYPCSFRRRRWPPWPLTPSPWACPCHQPAEQEAAVTRRGQINLNQNASTSPTSRFASGTRTCVRCSGYESLIIKQLTNTFYSQ